MPLTDPDKSEKQQIKTKIQFGQSVAAAAILSVCGAGSSLTADEPADTIRDLKKQNELLNQRVKTLEEQLNQRIKALEEQLDQKVKVIDRKRELDSERVDTKFKEAAEKPPPPSLFKVPEWVTSVRLI